MGGPAIGVGIGVVWGIPPLGGGGGGSNILTETAIDILTELGIALTTE